jgi:UPF0755 protein
MPPIIETENSAVSYRMSPYFRIRLRYVLIILLLGGLYVLWHNIHPPAAFQSDDTFEITPGMGVSAIASKAEQEGFVRSNFLLYFALTYLHNPNSVFAGTYRFSEPLSVFAFADKLASGEIERELVILTIPEGTRAEVIAQLAQFVLPDFNASEFVSLSVPYEGFLFPETYHIPRDFTARDLLDLLRFTYAEKTKELSVSLTESTLTEYEVITLASILEREANDERSMRIVSGILQNRLSIDMPLQADASIEYELDKPLGELVPEDLEIDSPYNTYLNRGLPPTPIGNPGLTAIKAVLEPETTDYLFYITGTDGNFYYAKTYDEHQDNIARYLR